MPQSPEALRKYSPRPVFLKPQHCMLCEAEFDSREQLDAHTEVAHREFQCSCGERFRDETSLHTHLSLHGQEGESEEHGAREDPPTYRQKVFAQAISDWPEAVTAQVHRTRLYEMKVQTTTFNFGYSACACCAMEKKNREMASFTFPRVDEEELPDWWEKQSLKSWQTLRREWVKEVSNLFSTTRYSKRWPLIPFETLHESRSTVPSPYEENGVCRWLLFLEKADQDRWGKLNEEGLPTFSCRFCKACSSGITRKHPELPAEAIANDKWGGPVPEEIECLSYAEKKIMQRARTYLDLKRAATSRIKKKSAQQWTTQGIKAAISYLQEPKRLVSLCMLLPEDLVETISVQFTGNDREAIREDKSLQVSVARLRAAFEWLVRHNPHWCEFGEVQEDGTVKKALALEELLLRYRAPDGSEAPAVPEAVVQSAVPVDEQAQKNSYRGPADAVVEKELESGSESESDTDLTAAVVEPPANQESAASLWSSALTNGQKLLGSVRAKDIASGEADVLRSATASADEDNPEAEQAAAEEVRALVSTVSDLRKFHHSEVQKELEEFSVRDSTTTPRIVVGFNHASTPIPSIPSIGVGVLPS